MKYQKALGDPATKSGSDSLQSYLGLYLHEKKCLIGYGLKVYKNMTQWRDNQELNDKKTDTTGFGHYFSIAYKF
ncbi:outer membrane protein OmpK [Aliarcobacter butzleri]|uniref:outer membrane protein OmpK n=1 Tax=Aliarcobacter butzleri TaxID=28197 RepID=UPI0021B69847|nr:outer membrane protein OmpK [Aliarcobacter butzleri]MCT7592947.1 outer membrane protein OmpK [Aliarcobacter butzleri]